ncbi:MAG TPA: SpoIIIAH-like family protein [Feifaniaceae bacterium]|nr:SpoIIIAH-like family protein [Feifaniaceae bacterium]
MKKKYGVLIGLVVLLVVAVFINIRLNAAAEGDAQNVNSPGGPDQVQITNADVDAEDYYEVFRADRESDRTQEVEYLDAIILNEDTDAETLADAQQRKLAIVDSMEKERNIESLIKAKGFDDAAVMVTEDSVNVVVKAAQIDTKQAAQILDIVYGETEVDAQNVKIYPSAN